MPQSGPDSSQDEDRPPTVSGAVPAMASTAPALSSEALDLATRLFNAARTGDAATLASALSAGLPADMTNERGDSLLMLAAYHGHADAVRMLLTHGADPNRGNDRGQSPLAGAVWKQEDAVVDVLLEGGANPNHGSPSAMQCLEMFGGDKKWKAKFEAAAGRANEASHDGLMEPDSSQESPRLLGVP